MLLCTYSARVVLVGHIVVGPNISYLNICVTIYVGNENKLMAEFTIESGVQIVF